ncbi:carbohydrate ABC transporter permease [Brevibacillus humidisoli]|uniref:carbohydrate ABC transporter permease n=1 Tax=Brevibacillus humidisoli TaxID=2895522 RepID=UPI001E5D2F3C|nr:carbohydrate ABC transporter permease [Brevibacillus humidisoli]UFJ39591.1 carbohydrate ABC transporter permease [Brevibacillus humidisoli]
MERYGQRSTWRNLLIIVLLVLFTLLMLLPVYILVKVSISEPEEVNTDHPTFLVHDATLEHWKSILMTDKKTESGQTIYQIAEGSYLLRTEDGDQLTLTPEDQFSINGVFRKVYLIDGPSVAVSLEELQKLREVSVTSKTFFGPETVRNLYAPLWKSFQVATLTTLFAILLAAPASYVISLMPKKVKYTVILSLLFTRMFPDVGIALPIATRFYEWQMIDTTTGLVMAHLIPNLPFLAWILVGTFDVIPRDLEKAALIDGANRMRALQRVILPIAAPGIGVGALFVWLNSWNEFIYARYLSSATSTLPIKIYEVITTGTFFSAAAYSTILTIPVIVITFYLQRYLQSGILSGAVK